MIAEIDDKVVWHQWDINTQRLYLITKRDEKVTSNVFMMKLICMAEHLWFFELPISKQAERARVHAHNPVKIEYVVAIINNNSNTNITPKAIIDEKFVDSLTVVPIRPSVSDAEFNYFIVFNAVLGLSLVPVSSAQPTASR